MAGKTFLMGKEYKPLSLIDFQKSFEKNISVIRKWQLGIFNQLPTALAVGNMGSVSIIGFSQI
ncbi:hypothetical protein [Cyclobacterium plantarum]|uniref:hypothetical protein n=1 Tax=Cyclobacterium plantarum TaxID=2716263 RepID=UPI003F6F59CB